MMEAEERVWNYFDTALENVSEARVVETFINSLKDMKPQVNGLELLKYTCDNLAKTFCMSQRKCLKRKAFENF